ncbi:hypothetical protein [Streptomyces orinoci]|uniref:ASCH domain-containing protein n=1 Tax=Streptomyces orinoci TaxID=67339 RepID=A0ABV3JRP0_STRON|nr:hypothetical protein [Streptomyces orinoci]
MEVRVGYPSMRKIAAGQVLVFRSGDDSFRIRVVKLVEYPSFEAMADAEDITAISGDLNREELLAAAATSTHPRRKPLASWRSIFTGWPDDVITNGRPRALAGRAHSRRTSGKGSVSRGEHRPATATSSRAA